MTQNGDLGLHSRMQKNLVAVPLSFLIVFILCLPNLSRAQTKAAKLKTGPLLIPEAVSVASPSALSPEFRKKAWRALDALERIDVSLSQGSVDTKVDALLLEADRASDEAKYEASTAFDLTVLHALQMANISLQTQRGLLILNPEWQRARNHTTQCRLEVTYAVHPVELSETGLKLAKLGDCNKQTSEWSAVITK
jgi:hypothetical protein